MDSGAAASSKCSGNSTKYQKNDVRAQLQIQDGMRLKGAGRSQLNVLGHYTIQLNIAGRSIIHDFFIVNNLTSDEIMGTILWLHTSLYYKNSSHIVF